MSGKEGQGHAQRGAGNRGDARGSDQRRIDRMLKEETQDTYMARSKPVEPTVCTGCGVVFSGGRWQWQPSPPDGAREALCPACQRIRDKVPAGYLMLGGEFFTEHRDEIMNLVQNKVEEQKAQHPMKRIMSIDEEKDGGVAITFTDMHLPRGVGQAIARAYEGDLDIHYAAEPGHLRVYWQR